MTLTPNNIQMYDVLEFDMRAAVLCGDHTIDEVDIVFKIYCNIYLLRLFKKIF